MKSSLFRFPGLSKVRRGWSQFKCEQFFLVFFRFAPFSRYLFSDKLWTNHFFCTFLPKIFPQKLLMSQSCLGKFFQVFFFFSCLQFLFSVHFSSEAGAATYLEKIFADKIIVWFLLKVKHFLEHDYFVEMEHRGLAL